MKLSRSCVVAFSFAAVYCVACEGDPDAPNTDTTVDTETSGDGPSTTGVDSSGAPTEATSDQDESTSTPQATTGGESDDTPTASAPEDAGSTDSEPLAMGQTAVGSRCERATRIGSMGVNVGTDRTIVSGAISNGVLPSAVPEVHAEGGGCQLLVPRDLFCTECSSDEACAGDDECIPKPVKVSAGAVEVTGLAETVEVSPNEITLDYSKTILEPFPAYEVGETIRISAQGDQAGGFTAQLIGVPRLSSDLDVIAVTRGEPALIEWDAENIDPEQSAVFITFSVNVHGAVTGWIECVAPDTGNFEVPQELVTELVDLGLSGFPRADLERRSSATVELSTGCVDIAVASKVTLNIEVEGLMSCNNNSECDQGQTCNEERVCE